MILPISWACRECGSTEGIIRVDGLCVLCTHPTKFRRGNKCRHCREYVDEKAAKYVKTSERWFCSEDHRKEYNRCQREQKKASTNSDRRPLQADGTGKPEGDSPMLFASGQKTSQIGSETTQKQLRTTPIAESFDHERVSRCLRAEGFDLADDPSPVALGDGRWEVTTVTRMVRQAAGRRVVTYSIKRDRYTLDWGDIKAGEEYDPLAS